MVLLTVLEKTFFSRLPKKEWWCADIPHPAACVQTIGHGDFIFGIGVGHQQRSVQKALNAYNIECQHHLLSFEQLIDFKKIITLGTPFQAQVWQTLLTIPSGTVLTYSDIATQIHHPKALRAVGGAVGANPVSFLIPCHRVIPKTGGIGGYYWGSPLKEKILKIEGYIK